MLGMCQTRISKRCNKWKRCATGAEATEKGGKPGGEGVLRRGGHVNTVPGRKQLGVF